MDPLLKTHFTQAIDFAQAEFLESRILLC